jgi:hypothetical protein
MPGPAPPPIKASSFLWAANRIRHIEEWHESKHAFDKVQNPTERFLREKQKASIERLAAVLGHAVPITENVAFEALQCLVATAENTGNYLQLKLHALRIGRDLIQRSGLAAAPSRRDVTMGTRRLRARRPKKRWGVGERLDHSATTSVKFSATRYADRGERRS